MGPLFISLGAGVLIGLMYALLNVRSPAPPAIALVGLLGMIIGGQLSAPFLHKSATAAVQKQRVIVPANAITSAADKVS